MLGYIWLFMISASVVCAFMTGRMDNLASAVTEGADKGVKLIISMAGVMCLWTGIMNIAEKSGLTKIISHILSPVLSRIMPDYRPDSNALQAVRANITANILGLGNAATPLGITAMKEMQKNNRLGDKPNSSMIMFVVINTASVQLIPASAAALRQAAGSTDPYVILPYVWISSLCALSIGVAAAMICSRLSGRRKRNG